MVIDIHSHLYSSRYIEMLRARCSIPRIVVEGGSERLLIFPEEDIVGVGGRGRPIDSTYWEIGLKLKYMETHGIGMAVLSFGNPWLDFLEPKEAVQWAYQLNEELQQICSEHPNQFCGLGVLPLQDIRGSIAELDHIAHLSHVRGAMVGTKGAGKGLDDPGLERVWESVERLGLILSVHPHYGIGSDPLGQFAYGLNIALGFPFETTIAIARLALSGIPQRFPRLKLIAAHGGGTVPYLSGRLDRIVNSHSGGSAPRPSEFLRNVYYDVTVYHAPAVRCALGFAGTDRLLFGTDHPFQKNPVEVYRSLEGLGTEEREAIVEGNARTLFGL